MSWQTIETAPEDGTEIEACIAPSRGGGPFRVFTCRKVAEPPRRPEKAWRLTGGFSTSITVNPTHWRPMSEPPADG